jgi:hypothetical protein
MYEKVGALIYDAVKAGNYSVKVVYGDWSHDVVMTLPKGSSWKRVKISADLWYDHKTDSVEFYNDDRPFDTVDVKWALFSQDYISDKLLFTWDQRCLIDAVLHAEVSSENSRRLANRIEKDERISKSLAFLKRMG